MTVSGTTDGPRQLTEGCHLVLACHPQCGTKRAASCLSEPYGLHVQPQHADCSLAFSHQGAIHQHVDIWCYMTGVLTFKRASEQALEASGIPYTIIRPSRLTDGPYTSFDLNTLLQVSGITATEVVSRGMYTMLSDCS